MNVVALSSLRAFWQKHPRAERPMRLFYRRLASRDWTGPEELKTVFGSVDFVGRNRAIFNVGGNKYRVIAAMDFDKHRAFIKFVGTHADYDRIDAETVAWKR